MILKRLVNGLVLMLVVGLEAAWLAAIVGTAVWLLLLR
jgi:hypothetical protein